MDQADDDSDTPWKDAVMRYFPEFMAFYFPAAHRAIDWSRSHAFLDQEFAALTQDAEFAKWRLTKMLYQRGWDKQRIIDLYRVIDWIMRLPKGLERRLRHGIMQLERREIMPYITSMERFGREEGLQEGLQTGLRKGQREGALRLLSSLLAKRFGPLQPAVRARLAKADADTLSAWALNVLDAATLDQVFR